MSSLGLLRTFTVVLWLPIAAALLGAGCDPCSSCVSPTKEGGSFSLTASMSAERFGHTASLLNDGSVLIAGGLAGAPLAVDLVDLAEIYDPAAGTFSPAPAMIQARGNHTATLLETGKVLIAGGDDGSHALNSAELFDPASGTFSRTAAVMTAPRTVHTATLLTGEGPQHGRVLIVGGSPAFDPANMIFIGSLSSAELFDPSSGQFLRGISPMSVARSGHTATLLSDGSSVLITGGVDDASVVQSTAEVFTTAKLGFTPTAPMRTPRFFHTATLLDDGTVLIAGGVDNMLNTLQTAELYDPKSRTFRFTSGNLNSPRALHRAALLNDGRVLIAGGSVDDSAEIYDPVSETFTLIPSSGSQRLSATVTPLPDGKVLVAGGSQLVLQGGSVVASASVPTAELVDPSSGSFLSTGAMVMARQVHTATFLDPQSVRGPLANKVLIAGGQNLAGSFAPAGSVFPKGEQLYEPDAHQFVDTAGLNQQRLLHTATVLNCATISGCPDGDVLIAGGIGVVGGVPTDLNSAELYANGTFVNAGPMMTARDSATATQLTDGRVLIASGAHIQLINGRIAFVPLDSAELYDPVMQVFSCVGEPIGSAPPCNSSMNSPRAFHTATLLPDHTVLLAGGITDSQEDATDAAELFNPNANGRAGGFTAVGPGKTVLRMTMQRFGHTATLLNSGNVLLAGGANDLRAEIYNPSNGVFSTVGDMTTVRFFHTASVLINGRVLLVGGTLGSDFFELFNSGSFAAEASAELFDPSTGAFAPVDSMNSERALHTATLLGTSQVLVVGGEGTNTSQASAELFMPVKP